VGSDSRAAWISSKLSGADTGVRSSFACGACAVPEMVRREAFGRWTRRDRLREHRKVRRRIIMETQFSSSKCNDRTIRSLRLQSRGVKSNSGFTQSGTAEAFPTPPARRTGQPESVICDVIRHPPASTTLQRWRLNHKITPELKHLHTTDVFDTQGPPENIQYGWRPESAASTGGGALKHRHNLR
jgi:hypothetical protein